VTTARGRGAVDQGQAQNNAARQSQRGFLGGKLAGAISIDRRGSGGVVAAFNIRALLSIKYLDAKESRRPR
jgi:hypothetical protein